MNMEDEEKNFLKSKAETSITKTNSLDINSPKVRRRYVVETNNSSATVGNDSNRYNEVFQTPMDTEKAWVGDVPPMSDILETLTQKERIKIRVVQSTVAEADLTFARLRLLGVSSEGFVIGSYDHAMVTP